MKSIFIVLVSALLLPDATSQSVKSASAKKVYTNPLPVQFGDPYVLQTGGKYYMYGTGGGAKAGFSAYTSTDLVNWQPVGQVYYSKGDKAWGIGAFWAPEVYEVNNKYYLFYSAQWKENPTNELENFKIGVAVADKPGGPFIDLTGKPLFDPGYPIIDANVFFDGGGKTCAVVVGPNTFIFPFSTFIRSINTTLSLPVLLVLPWYTQNISFLSGE